VTRDLVKRPFSATGDEWPPRGGVIGLFGMGGGISAHALCVVRGGRRLTAFVRDVASMGRETIDVVRARTNNLRDVSVSIPKGQLVAFTGVSGSGKTSLAIDTLHAEAQLRYLEGLSPFVRQYITQRNRPKVDRILGLGATLAVDQRRLNRNPRSTVATITGIDGHLGLLYSRLPGIGADPVAESGDGHLTTAHFDRSTPEGSCVDCHGVGGRWQAQEDLVITHPELPLFEGASPWYAKWRSGEHAFVPALADKRGVDLGRPWLSLPEEFRHCVLYGTGDEKIEATVDMPNKNETALMTYTSSQPLRGALAEVERVFVNAQTSSAKQRYLPYMRKQPCGTCGPVRAARRADVPRPARGGSTGGAQLGEARGGRPGRPAARGG
jgi:excinuclease ABC subunit A